MWEKKICTSYIFWAVIRTIEILVLPPFSYSFILFKSESSTNRMWQLPAFQLLPLVKPDIRWRQMPYAWSDLVLLKCFSISFTLFSYFIFQKYSTLIYTYLSTDALLFWILCSILLTWDDLLFCFYLLYSCLFPPER